MIKAIISNNEVVHTGNFGIHVSISHPISNISISDFIFEAVDGNGITGINLPDSLEQVYIGKYKQTLLMIPVDLPDNVSGSFKVSMQNKLYTLDNTQYDASSAAVILPDTEQHSILCEEKIFIYVTGD